MKALLLCAGLGTRLKPVTDFIPKCLVPIHGIPLLDIWCDQLVSAGVTEILINIHHHSSQVKKHIQQSPCRDYITLVEETDELLGTGGTIRNNRDFFADKPALIIHADNLSFADLPNFIEFHRRLNPPMVASMMCFHTDVPEQCGIVELTDKGIVKAFHEKVSNPPGTLANGAVYIFEPTVIDEICALRQDFIDLSTEIIPTLINRCAAWKNTVYHRDIGRIEALFSAQKELSQQHLDQRLPAKYIDPLEHTDIPDPIHSKGLAKKLAGEISQITPCTAIGAQSLNQLIESLNGISPDQKIIIDECDPGITYQDIASLVSNDFLILGSH